MRASLDTNVIIHLYRANLQDILFDFFKDGIIVYEQILNVELMHHGQDVLSRVDLDIASGKIMVYTDDLLKKQSAFKLFQNNVHDNKLLYGAGDLGEVYAISLAQTIGTYSLITDDTKQGGPYMSLLQLEYDVMPFNFADVLILRYLIGVSDERQTVADFNTINAVSNLQWSFRSQIKKFIKRFLKEPYKVEEKAWICDLIEKNNIKIKTKFSALEKLV